MIIKVKLGGKGQVVIPKIVRESIGLRENSTALLEVKEKKVEIRPLSAEDIVEKASEMARKYGGNVSKWIFGDRLYEEEFGKSYGDGK
ncbi:AbrB/MazE/SpoVT family DNA-binding domain-containing protein [Candidatus Woesearchaeota archaeon]|nr:AbrB/MazE/SpoVT family DNA-binding domain-containing protein [Candidatus Woesearchaeota archaeon]